MAMKAKPRHVPPRISRPVPRHVLPRMKPVPSIAPELIQKQDSYTIGRWTSLLLQQYEDKTMSSESPNDDWSDVQGDPQQYQYEDENEGSHAYNNDEMWYDNDWYDNKGDLQQASSHQVSNEDSEYESIEEEEVQDQDFNQEEVIRMTKQVLQDHGCSPKGKFGRRSRGKPGKRGGKRAQAYRSSSRTRRAKKRPRDAMSMCEHGPPNYDSSDSSSSILGDKRERCQVPVSRLRYSQRSCKETFQCGSSVSGLVRDLWYGKVKVCAPFLRLTVFEIPDRKTGRPVLRCIDNRRLYALKEYADLLGEEDLLVHINLYNMEAYNDFSRLRRNLDPTDGYGVRLRKNKQ